MLCNENIKETRTTGMGITQHEAPTDRTLHPLLQQAGMLQNELQNRKYACYGMIHPHRDSNREQRDAIPTLDSGTREASALPRLLGGSPTSPDEEDAPPLPSAPPAMLAYDIPGGGAMPGGPAPRPAEAGGARETPGGPEGVGTPGGPLDWDTPGGPWLYMGTPGGPEGRMPGG